MPTSSDAAPLHIICFRWGERYGAEYVNKLYSMVGRNLPLSHVFHCVTDQPSGLAAGIKVHPLPADHFNANWNKLMMFQKDFLGLGGQLALCLDVDIVIVGDISFLTAEPEKDFLIAKNWATGVRGNSSVYRLRVGSHLHVWEDFNNDTAKNIADFHGKNLTFGDQQWMNHAIKDYGYFPEGKIVSFKRHCGAKGLEIKLPCIGNVSTGRLGRALPPDDAAIVLFHGDPLPPDVRDSHSGRWRQAPFVSKHWH